MSDRPPRQDVAKIVAERTEGLGVDVACVMSGHPDAIRQGFRSVRNGGRVQLLGIPSKEITLDLSRDVIFKGITVYGVIGRKMFETWHQMSTFLEAGLIDLDPVITHMLPFDQFEKGLSAMASGDQGKVHSDDGVTDVRNAQSDLQKRWRQRERPLQGRAGSNPSTGVEIVVRAHRTNFCATITRTLD